MVVTESQEQQSNIFNYEGETCMKPIKAALLGAALVAGLGLFSRTDASAESLYTVEAGDTLSTTSH